MRLHCVCVALGGASRYVAIRRDSSRYVAMGGDASRSDALCAGLSPRLKMAIRRYVAICGDMWRCHALCVPYVSKTPLPEISACSKWSL